MNKTRIVARIAAGAATAALILAGLAAGPAQAKDTGWGPTGGVVNSAGAKATRDTGWGSI